MIEDIDERSAVLSADGQYRYQLDRRWEIQGPTLTFIMLNPSTANAYEDDPTIRRCVSFAKREHFGGIRVFNLYAYRTPSPAELWLSDNPVGMHNDYYLHRQCTAHVLCAWGANADVRRAAYVRRVIRRPWRHIKCLGVNGDGSPKHPLYIRADAPFVPYPSAATEESDQ